MNVYTHIGLDEKAGAVATLSAPQPVQDSDDNREPAADESGGEGRESDRVVPKMVPKRWLNVARR